MEGDAVMPGGNANRGLVVRRGNSVRKPSGKTSTAVAAVLSHLREVGFEGAPPYLGTDAEGRDIFGWVEGDVVTGPPPKWVSSSATLARVAALLRSLHDALSSFVDEQPWIPLWAPPPVLAGDQLCHGDVGYSNVVFRGREPVAFIDFEFIVRADPLLDVASVASQWTTVPRMSAEDTEERERRVAEGVLAVASAYQLSVDERARLPAAMVAVEESAIDYLEERVRRGDPAAKQAVRDGVLVRRGFRSRWMNDHGDYLARLLRAAEPSG